MSTKIYTGFKVKHNNPARLLQDLKVMQLELTEKVKKEISALLPQGKLFGEKEEEKHNEDIIDTCYKECFMADVVIYFKEDKIIGTYFIHDRKTEKWFRSQTWFEDYHYQNQADRDDNISEEEWEQREKDWEFLDIPADDGFTFQLVNPNNIKLYWIAWWRQDNLPSNLTT